MWPFSSISGNAMPIDIKAINYIVLNPGEGVNFEVPGDVLANATDCRDMRVENINMSQLTTFPDLPNLQRLYVQQARSGFRGMGAKLHSWRWNAGYFPIRCFKEFQLDSATCQT